jgi:hypothetical protein
VTATYKEDVMKVLTVLVMTAVAYINFLAGGFFERHLSWKPIENGVWQKQVITWSGLVKVTVDYSHGDLWLTVRQRCSGTSAREEVFDFIVGSQAASWLDCSGKNSDVSPDPRWGDWFKDAPRPSAQMRPTRPDLTQPIYNGRHEPKTLGPV